jgi:phosphate uptake regulator
MNPTLESRLDALRDALDNLAHMVDENLRAVMLRLTLEQDISQHSPLVVIDQVAADAREKCLLLVAREHPLATDLKYAMAALRVGHDYERIQELTLALGKRVERLRGGPLQQLVREMTGIMSKILKLHEIVQRTWQRGEGKTPLVMADVQLLVGDIDAQITALQNRIMDAIADGGTNPEVFVELVLACRHLKRILNTLQMIPDELHAFDKK